MALASRPGHFKAPSGEAGGSFAAGADLLSVAHMTRADRSSALAILIVSASVATLSLMGRDAICPCGTVSLWEADPNGPRTSQMLLDWYSPSHVVHGLALYGLLWLAARDRSLSCRFLIALAIEALWEVVENTPWVIDRYREATIALGYNGDSLLNSLSDMAMMCAGFLAARRLPVWTSLALVAALELVPLLVIRDNLVLNIVMLLAPNEAIRSWQSAL